MAATYEQGHQHKHALLFINDHNDLYVGTVSTEVQAQRVGPVHVDSSHVPWLYGIDIGGAAADTGGRCRWSVISCTLIDVNIDFDIDILYSRGESMMLRAIKHVGKPS